MKNDIRNINSSNDIIVAADKTKNMKTVSHEKYDKLVNSSIAYNIFNTIASKCRKASRRH